MLRLLILGSAAGGGFPQWNSAGSGCRRARAGDPAARPRTQSSVAVSADGRRWVLLNASPDIRSQIEANPPLHPQGVDGPRSTPIAAIVLTNADVDHIAGLLSLREEQAFVLYATERVHAVLRANPIFNVLREGVVRRSAVPLDRSFAVTDPAGAPVGIEIEMFAVPGKVALYLEGEAVDLGMRSGDTVGLRVRSHADDGPAFFYIPGCAALPPDLAERLRGAPLVLFDGTLWRDDEMIRAGIGRKTGQRMGHISIDGPQGALAAFRDLGVKRKVFVHLNNTNPVLLADSPEHAAVRAAGWEVARDGMEIRL